MHYHFARKRISALPLPPLGPPLRSTKNMLKRENESLLCFLSSSFQLIIACLLHSFLFVLFILSFPLTHHLLLLSPNASLTRINIIHFIHFYFHFKGLQRSHRYAPSRFFGHFVFPWPKKADGDKDGEEKER